MLTIHKITYWNSKGAPKILFQKHKYIFGLQCPQMSESNTDYTDIVNISSKFSSNPENLAGLFT